LAEDIRFRLDAINEDNVVNSFFVWPFNIQDKACTRLCDGVELARKLNFDLRFINETAIMETTNLHLPFTGVNIESIINDITTASKIDPKASRRKYLLGTLRGVGGGKTRMIEECRIRMGLLYPNWLPIAITFNHQTEIRKSDYSWKDSDLMISYAICCRIISSVYSISIEEAQISTNIVLKSVMEEYVGKEALLAIDLIVGTVSHVAARVKQKKPTVDSFVLFIDECAKLIENSPFPNENDPYSSMRRTILGEDVGKILKTSLVMTSLNISVFGITDSSRATKPVVLASKLSVEHIVTKIWIPPFNSSSKKTGKRDIAILKLLAATVNSAPRLVELMGRALRNEFENTWPVSRVGQSLTQSLGAVLEDYEGDREEYILSICKISSGLVPPRSHQQQARRSGLCHA